MKRSEPWIFVLSAPSGAGKTTLSDALLTRVAGLKRAVTTTTRPKRVDETDGVSYHFVSRKQFEEMLSRGEFLEHAEVHGNLYGPTRKAVMAVLSEGHHCLLVIDVQGAKTIRQNLRRTCLIFLEPPNFNELERRLRTRGSDPEHIIRERLENAKKELRQKKFYDYCVVNEDIDEAATEMVSIIKRVLDEHGY